MTDINYLEDLEIIQPKNIRMKKVKNMFFGLQGAGKTYGCKQLTKMHKMRTLVYSPHRRDFDNESDLFIYFKYTDFYADFEKFIDYAIALGEAGQIDGILVDEFDMIFKAGLTRSNLFVDFIANHRHYGLGASFIARRPQDIDAFIVESCEFLVGYSIMGDNVKQKLNRIYKNYGSMVQQIPKGSYKAIVLEIGAKPKILNPLPEM